MLRCLWRRHFNLLYARHLWVPVVAATLIFLTSAYYLFVEERSTSSTSSTHFHPTSKNVHVIDRLILQARAQFSQVLTTQTFDIHAAAEGYRSRRGRHPPPEFDRWFEYAQEHNCIVVESFFDQIYHDLQPFWAIDPGTLRLQSQAFEHVISVRAGKATYKTDEQKRVPWIQLWSRLMKEIQENLPDVDIHVNLMDESRVAAPWEEINRLVDVADSSKQLAPIENLIGQFSSRKVDDEGLEVSEKYEPGFRSGNIWELIRIACPPNSTARSSAPWDLSQAPTVFGLDGNMEKTGGFISNWTAAKQISPMYLSSDSRYSGSNGHGGDWNAKTNKVLWRGVASGGRNKAENWRHFQRHRFVQMMNGTRLVQAQAQAEEQGDDVRIETFELPLRARTTHPFTYNESIGPWLDNIADVAFIDLVCFPGTGNPHCPYTEPFFKPKKRMRMSKMYGSKYLPDVDGNSFSGRYRALLQSTSLPIKATLYSEWHDSRLFPWVHFVPMDNSFADLHGLLQYFLGYENREGHDDAARQIAEEGKSWSERVLRREDMALYTYRLLREWARICDDRRIQMGWFRDPGLEERESDRK